MRMVVLTSGIPYAQRILLGLCTRGLVPDALMIVSPLRAGAGVRRTVRSLRRRRSGDLARAVGRRATAKVRGPQDLWTPWAREVHFPGALNGQPMLDLLRRLEPDYLVLAGVGIVSAEALSVPRRGTLNVHPGLLPWAPGVGVIERSFVEREVPLGVTAHFVDAGVDTGPLIRRELVPVHERDTMRSLRAKVYERAAELMVDVVEEAMQGGELRSQRQEGSFPMCAWPARAEVAAAAEAVRSGRALSLYREWRDFHGSDVLQLDAFRRPSETLPAAVSS